MSQVEGTKGFVVALYPEDLKALNEVVKRGRKAEDEWRSAARERAGVEYLRGRAASDARRRIRVQFAELRERGRLAGTRDLVMTRAVRAELKSRKLNQDWDEPPPGETNAPGRRVGAVPDHYGHAAADDDEEPGFGAKMAVKLPTALGEQLVRAAYWTSAPHVEALRRWYDRWGDGPDVILRESARANGGMVSDLAAIVAMMAPRPHAAALVERAELRSKIITTGDLMRAAVARATR